MFLEEYNWLADENIHPDWIKATQKFTRVYPLAEFNLLGASDSIIMEFCLQNHLLLFTQDADFGRLALAEKQPFIGIIYLRPGHLNPQHHIQTIEKILSNNIEVIPPFILVAHNKNGIVRIRIRFGVTA